MTAVIPCITIMMSKPRRWLLLERTMGKRARKGRVISFKVDPSLLEAMRGVPNRSAFIRAACLAALDSTCPLCKGTGILSPNQKLHWEALAHDHSVEECEDCHELRLVCSRGEPSKCGERPRNRSSPRRRRR